MPYRLRGAQADVRSILKPKSYLSLPGSYCRDVLYGLGQVCVWAGPEGLDRVPRSRILPAGVVAGANGSRGGEQLELAFPRPVFSCGTYVGHSSGAFA
ncbi:hypothetical protein AAFF_G00279510 [Aldrovandia affinis]|uniref:Uncharacterized protein n=1 Tax=Aldrovandia affinis TaxID=143900 RepID=A0AAD7SSH9_9TELE|nr:hypothetical protein AAFF_G00279510 [Aldrovandia affinis]